MFGSVAEWHRICFFGNVAEVCKNWLHKGDLIAIEGRIKTEKYIKDNVEHTAKKIVGEKMTMLQTGGKQSRPIDNTKTDEEFIDNDIEF